MVIATDKMPFSYHLLLSFNSINFFKYTSIECFIGKGKPARFVFFTDRKSNSMRTTLAQLLGNTGKRPKDYSLGRFYDSASQKLSRHALSDIYIFVNLVEVQVFVDSRAVFVDDAHGFVVLGYGGDVA